MCRRNGSGAGWVAVIVGTIILLTLILPRWFWWLVCAGALICGGIRLLWR